MPAELTAELAWDQWDAMVSAAYVVLGSRDEAADCSTQAVVQVMERRPGVVDNPEAYMVTIAKRRAIDRVRAQVRERRALARAGAEVATADVAEDVCDRGEAAWVDAYARARLDPTVYALLRHLGDGLSVAEAASATGMTYKAAEGHLSRARRMMRAASARALAALLGLLVGLRRWAAGPALTVGVAVAAVVVTLPPTASPGPSVPMTLTPVVDRSPRAATAASERVAQVPRVAASAAPRRPSAAPAVAPVGKPVTLVTTPPASVDVYQRQDGYQARGPVDRAQHCLQTLSLRIRDLGCR